MRKVAQVAMLVIPGARGLVRGESDTEPLLICFGDKAPSRLGLVVAGHARLTRAIGAQGRSRSRAPLVTAITTTTPARSPSEDPTGGDRGDASVPAVARSGNPGPCGAGVIV